MVPTLGEEVETSIVIVVLCDGRTMRQEPGPLSSALWPLAYGVELDKIRKAWSKGSKDGIQDIFRTHVWS